MTPLEREILERLGPYQVPVDSKRIMVGITATRHPSRLRVALDDMDRQGMILADDELRYVITNLGRRLLRMER